MQANRWYNRLMFITILGRQPAFGVAELERLYGGEQVHWLSQQAALASVKELNFEQLGGSLKAGRIVLELRGNWRSISQAIVKHYEKVWRTANHKLTLGISGYGFDVQPREVQKTGLILKKLLQKSNISLRLIPNIDAALSTATSHHNKLGLSPHRVELLVVRAANGTVFVAESIGAQNITALAARDQARPKTDAFVGMLPPKLAQIMVNLSGAAVPGGTLWDPFCGTGTILQEARLKGINTYGSDLSQKMVDYTTENMYWLDKKYAHSAAWDVFQADAAAVQLDEHQRSTIKYIVCETYLGQPFSAPPKPDKLREVVGNCNHIIIQFLINLREQISSDATLVLAVPAWRDHDGNFTHLPLINQLSNLGYTRISLQHVSDQQLLYYRETQVVAREILILAPQSTRI